MYAQTTQTGRSFRDRPLLLPRDISGNSMCRFYTQMLDYFAKHSNDQISIGDTAVQFYLANHGIALLDTEKGLDAELSREEAELYKTYHREVGKVGVRMVYDIVFMLTAMSSTVHPDGYHMDMVKTLYGTAAADFIEKLNGQTQNVSFWTPNFSQLKPVLETARNNAGNINLGVAIRSMGYVLDMCQRELSYGPLWRDIARMASEFFEGRKSLETMIDTAFTFCHCNGSFFEKGKLFTAVGNELFKALDVQRSGQIPQYVFENRSPLTKHALTRSMHAQFAQRFPEVFKSKVVWGNVKEVTRNQLVFTNKYKQHWAGLGGRGQQAHEAPKPKIFSPFADEDDYKSMIKGF